MVGLLGLVAHLFDFGFKEGVFRIVGVPMLLLVALLAPLAVSQPAEPWAPLTASAVSIQGAGAAVFWVPGSEAADSYRVYGIADNGAKTLLEQNVTQPSVPVPAGFHAYAVSSVKGGIESDPVTALGTCVEISIQPPAVRVCFTAGRAKAEVETNILE